MIGETMTRANQNPLITTKDIQPTLPSLKVDGVFNCGATTYKGQTVLLLRVAESAVSKSGMIDVPVLNSKNEIEIQTIDKSNPNYLFHDSRTISHLNRKVAYLTSLSHLRRAFSTDGIHFQIDDKPWIFPQGLMESWGVEDPRITQIENTYFITYTAVSPHGVSVGLIETKDFETYTRKGLILPVDNKDVSLLPEKVNGKYYMYHRPVPSDIGYPNMWVASSEDLIHWGNHQLLMTVNKTGWDNGRVGGGAPSVKTDRGWLHIYHAATSGKAVYSLGAFLTPLDNPTLITHKTKQPILKPETTYEKEGFFGDVVFTCGVILKNNTLNIYYGAADDKICLASLTLEDLYPLLEPIEGAL